ncbi:hypothetical protein Deba_0172 [Desulfarculus baarsii DSM 2075]|uniref:Uncharacterized protein n=1 Tax=Desulfarculus baarsii (strain ATCC 33931 / DSM 2075 / LMG 7858 / VKM B-1802 / 2st14) TaxID=644282 RepID=E1QDN2_DESB2|nr:DUF6125 family protein [Desulfarculus baarsii]ADK83551.1 hypothetical protein Deba_0172 [Desulfarculus baarsii DSM 2075]
MKFDGKQAPEWMDKNQLKQLLTRGWMTHDAMWFQQCLAEVGVERANKLNRGAIRAMAGREVTRLKAALGVERVTDMAGLRRFMVAGLELSVGDFMSFGWEWGPSSMRMVMERCFAQRGMTALGVADRYECGIYERIYAWLDALGVEHHDDCPTNLCQMIHYGHCRREMFFRFPDASPTPPQKPLNGNSSGAVASSKG